MSQQELIAEFGVDVSEAPPGYYPVLKESLDHGSGNLCCQCDWRPSCQEWQDAYSRESRYRCMPWARHDGMSVAFKKLEARP